MLALVFFYPLFYAFYLSLYDYNFGSGVKQFIGLLNYATLLSEARFWESLLRTCLIVAAAVSLEFGVGLVTAYALYRLTRGARIFNVLLFLPLVVTPAVAALFLRWLLIGRFGLISAVLISLGIFPPDFLGSPGWARASVVFADFWQFTPFVIMVLYAGLNTVDQSQIEAAQIDGAGPWTVLRRVMIPSIRPLIIFVLAIRVMDAFRFFDTIYVLTSGGPGTATETITMYTYVLAFRLLDLGKASALGVLTMMFLLMLTIALYLVVYRGKGEDAR